MTTSGRKRMELRVDHNQIPPTRDRGHGANQAGTRGDPCRDSLVFPCVIQNSDFMPSWATAAWEGFFVCGPWSKP